jgi:hydrogenase maturation factor HypF (carbamoyltransferase family)
MIKKSTHPIAFRINHIETLQFAVLQETVNENELSLSASFGFGIDKVSKLVKCIYKYEFNSEDKLALIIESAIDFAIEDVSFKEHILKNEECILPKTFAAHIAMIVVGTTRGILFEKTKGTQIGAFPMPTINVTEHITEDVVFDLTS